MKFVPLTEVASPAPYNSGGILVYGGQLLAQGTEENPVYFTSSHDDSVGGDTNGSGRATARGDWENIRFTASTLDIAVEAPMSVLENVVIRYGGEASSTHCVGGESVEVTDLGRASVTRSEITDSLSSGMSIDPSTPGVGYGSVSHTRFARSNCGVYARGGEVVNNVFESSLSFRSVYAAIPSRVRIYGNFMGAKSAYGGTSGITRMHSDVRFNYFAGGVVDEPSNQDHTDLSMNAWPGPFPETCYNPNVNYQPAVRWLYTGVPCSPSQIGTVIGYFTQVTPFFVDFVMPEAGPGAAFSSPLPVSADQVLGDLAGGSEFANRPVGSVSDPVSSATGSFFMTTADVTMSAVGLPVVASRTYNSAGVTSPSVSASWLGRGWSSSLQESLSVAADQSSVTFVAGDGQRVRFTRQADQSYLGDAGTTAVLTRESSTGPVYWKLRTRSAVTRSFDSGGRLLNTADANGNQLVYTRDGAGRVTSVVNGSRSLSVAYVPGRDLIGSITMPDGRSTEFHYDGPNKLLTAVTDLAGRTTNFAYNAGGQLTSVTRSDGVETLRLGYAASGRVSDQWDAKGAHTTFAWDEATQTSVTTDPRGGQWTDRYDNNVLLSRTGADGATTSYRYDARLQLVSVDSPRGARRTMGWSDRGDLVSVSGPDGPVTTVFDNQHRPVSTVNARGIQIDYSYDGSGNLVEIRRPNPVAANSPLTTSVTYDDRGLPVAGSDARGKQSEYLG